MCSGNICRSPMAESMFRDRIEQHGYGDKVVVESFGTGPWHVGDGADTRAIAVLRNAGLDATGHRARQIDGPAAARVDLLVALDSGHARELKALAPSRAASIVVLRTFDPDADDLDVPDPYYGGLADFASVRDMLERPLDALVSFVMSAAS